MTASTDTTRAEGGDCVGGVFVDAGRTAQVPIEIICPAAAFWGDEPSAVAGLIAAVHQVISAIREIEPA
ncbi:MAG: hypothetical protein KDB24_07855 [Microthrixaceae bacterium]|nr:hypothetical protein [Microthrixaceae bacterium]